MDETDPVKSFCLCFSVLTFQHDHEPMFLQEAFLKLPIILMKCMRLPLSKAAIDGVLWSPSTIWCSFTASVWLIMVQPQPSSSLKSLLALITQTWSLLPDRLTQWRSLSTWVIHFIGMFTESPSNKPSRETIRQHPSTQSRELIHGFLLTAVFWQVIQTLIHTPTSAPAVKNLFVSLGVGKMSGWALCFNPAELTAQKKVSYLFIIIIRLFFFN